MEVIGYIAACLTTAAFVPQVWKVYRTRDTRAISLAMYLIFSIGVCLWLIYGWWLGSWPIVLANGVTLLLSLSILWMKWND